MAACDRPRPNKAHGDRRGRRPNIAHGDRWAFSLQSDLLPDGQYTIHPTPVTPVPNMAHGDCGGAIPEDGFFSRSITECCECKLVASDIAKVCKIDSISIKSITTYTDGGGFRQTHTETINDSGPLPVAVLAYLPAPDWSYDPTRGSTATGYPFTMTGWQWYVIGGPPVDGTRYVRKTTDDVDLTYPNFGGTSAPLFIPYGVAMRFEDPFDGSSLYIPLPAWDGMACVRFVAGGEPFAYTSPGSAQYAYGTLVAFGGFGLPGQATEETVQVPYGDTGTAGPDPPEAICDSDQPDPDPDAAPADLDGVTTVFVGAVDLQSYFETRDVTRPIFTAGPIPSPAGTDVQKLDVAVVGGDPVYSSWSFSNMTIERFDLTVAATADDWTAMGDLAAEIYTAVGDPDLPADGRIFLYILSTCPMKCMPPQIASVMGMAIELSVNAAGAGATVTGVWAMLQPYFYANSFSWQHEMPKLGPGLAATVSGSFNTDGTGTLTFDNVDNDGAIDPPISLTLTFDTVLAVDHVGLSALGLDITGVPRAAFIGDPTNPAAPAIWVMGSLSGDAVDADAENNAGCLSGQRSIVAVIGQGRACVSPIMCPGACLSTNALCLQAYYSVDVDGAGPVASNLGLTLTQVTPPQPGPGVYEGVTASGLTVRATITNNPDDIVGGLPSCQLEFIQAGTTLTPDAWAADIDVLRCHPFAAVVRPRGETDDDFTLSVSGTAGGHTYAYTFGPFDADSPGARLFETLPGEDCSDYDTEHPEFVCLAIDQMRVTIDGQEYGVRSGQVLLTLSDPLPKWTGQITLINRSGGSSTHLTANIILSILGFARASLEVKNYLTGTSYGSTSAGLVIYSTNPFSGWGVAADPAASWRGVFSWRTVAVPADCEDDIGKTCPYACLNYECEVTIVVDGGAPQVESVTATLFSPGPSAGVCTYAGPGGTFGVTVSGTPLVYFTSGSIAVPSGVPTDPASMLLSIAGPFITGTMDFTLAISVVDSLSSWTVAGTSFSVSGSGHTVDVTISTGTLTACSGVDFV